MTIYGIFWCIKTDTLNGRLISGILIFLQVVLLVLEVHACIARDAPQFRQLVVYLMHNFRVDHSLLEKWVFQCSLEQNDDQSFTCNWHVWSIKMFNVAFCFSFRRGALIIRRLCVLLDAERVYRQLSSILEEETDLDFASIMVQVRFTFLNCWPLSYMRIRVETANLQVSFLHFHLNVRLWIWFYSLRLSCLSCERY